MGIKEYLVTRKKDIFDVDVKPRWVNFFLSKDYILSVVGPRRVGKTFFIYHVIRKLRLSESDFVFVNFEEEIDSVKISELPFIHKEIYGVLPKYIFLDEVQAVDNWVRGVYTLFERKKYIIFITGSSSKLMAYEIATQLRGRGRPIFIYPFSIPEIAVMKGINIRDTYDQYTLTEFKHLLRKRMYEGFFPDVVLGNIPPKIFYQDYIDLILYKDIIERYGIRNIYAMEAFIRSLIASNTKIFSINKLYNSLKSKGIKISKNTIYDYQKILEDMRIFFFLRKYSESLKKTMLSLPKVYSIDTGIISYNSPDQSITKELEHTFFLELLKDGFEANKNIFYWRDPEGYEVDFVIVENGSVSELIQISYVNDVSEIKKREVRALIKASKQFVCRNLKIITWDAEERIRVNDKDIQLIPFWRWLIEKIKRKFIPQETD